MRSPDVVIAGAGLIGLACALECKRRGLDVAVLEKGEAGQEASWAAAGMLAAHDPTNPQELTTLAELSIALYPGFLAQVAQTTGTAVPIETEWTLEEAADVRADIASTGLNKAGFRRIAEQSLNPRQLTAAVRSAVQCSGIALHEHCAVLSYKAGANGVEVVTENGSTHAAQLLDCTGAWSRTAVRPAKGQMVRVHAPGALHVAGFGNMVVRTGHFYLVPRLDGTIVIGATVEDAGFDKTLHADDLRTLQERAAALVPALAHAPVVESWAGLRPDTPDHLPLLGEVERNVYLAAGHFRNGVLLAPATAHLMAKMLCGQPPEVDLSAFAPGRFASVIM